MCHRVTGEFVCQSNALSGSTGLLVPLDRMVVSSECKFMHASALVRAQISHPAAPLRQAGSLDHLS